MPITIGDKLSQYAIVEAIGAGGMGEVYRARDTKLRRDVAIKVLPQQLAESPEASARFEREAQAVAALSHPNILAIHDFGTHGGITYAVMELLEGETFDRDSKEARSPRAKRWTLHFRSVEVWMQPTAKVSLTVKSSQRTSF